jgi:hypothetical protein
MIRHCPCGAELKRKMKYCNREHYFKYKENYIRTPEHRQRISDWVKKGWANPVTRARHLAQMKDNFTGSKGKPPSNLMLAYAVLLCKAGYLMDKVFITRGKKGSGGPYLLDFAHPEAKINIEIDGKTHQFRKEHDNIRDERLRSLGWKVIRIKEY